MTANCPHCGKTIDIVGASELNDEYQIGANRLQHARDTGKFPEPWLKFGNRNIYLRDDIVEWNSNRSQEAAGKTVTVLKGILDSLPPEEAARVLKELTGPSKR